MHTISLGLGSGFGLGCNEQGQGWDLLAQNRHTAILPLPHNMPITPPPHYLAQNRHTAILPLPHLLHVVPVSRDVLPHFAIACLQLGQGHGGLVAPHAQLQDVILGSLQPGLRVRVRDRDRVRVRDRGRDRARVRVM